MAFDFDFVAAAVAVEMKSQECSVVDYNDSENEHYYIEVGEVEKGVLIVVETRRWRIVSVEVVVAVVFATVAVVV